MAPWCPAHSHTRHVTTEASLDSIVKVKVKPLPLNRTELFKNGAPAVMHILFEQGAFEYTVVFILSGNIVGKGEW